MAITTINSLAIPAGTVVSADLTYPLTGFSSTGIDDNATSTAITIDSSENVGIGTTSPASKLEVSGTSTGAWITLDRQDSGSNIVDFTQSGTRLGYIGYIVNDLILNNATASNTIFNTNNTERMRIDSSGNVGIGTSSPSANLEIASTTTIAGARLTTSAGSDSEIEFINTSSGNHTWAIGQDFSNSNAFSIAYSNAVGASLSSNSKVVIDSSGNVGIGTSSPQSYTNYRNLHIAGPTTTGSGLLYLTNSDSSIVGLAFAEGDQARVTFGSQTNHPVTFLTNDTERMRIDSSGTINIGTTAAGGGSGNVGVGFTQIGRTISNCDGDWNYEIFGAQGNRIRFFTSAGGGTQVGSITVTTSTTAYNTSSDQRLKENIVDAPAGNIDAIRVRSFDWKADGSHQTYGMVAQELVDVAPEAVTQGNTEDDLWSVDYSKLVPMMIKEIQDLKAEVAALKGA